MEVFMIMIGMGLFSAVGLFVAFLLRKVVPTNEIHIVQSTKATTSYGKDTENGNTYYAWPSFLPLLGVTITKLDVSVFSLDLDGYEAYDQGRLPFVVDVKAFFRITDSNVAAQRVSSFEELKEQLKAIVQGAVRVILASNGIEDILQGRSTFGEQFTREVSEQLKSWGVSTVKNIELMDIRDGKDSKVIANIMDKKKSYIEMQSRVEVATNKQTAQVAEITAKQTIDLRDQEAKQAVGVRNAEQQREVELTTQKALQSIKEQELITKQKEMDILKVKDVRTAEIARDVKLVQAEQDKQTIVIAADGALEAKRKESEGITLEGTAKAEAEKAMLLAPVEAQKTLAREIGNNEGYQKYLVTIRQLEANEKVGIEQAKALTDADVKVIVNSDNPGQGLTNAMDLFSSSGGTKLGSMLEGLKNTEVGNNLLTKIGINDPKPISNGSH